MKLSELQTGEKAVIAKVNGHGSFRKRLIEMGFIQGKEVTVILNAPLKDPIEYEIIGYKISLRREEMAPSFWKLVVEDGGQVASSPSSTFTWGGDVVWNAVTEDSVTGLLT
ncbi:MAG: ferrous iron transport protein A, partial [Bacteroidales bacterium]|nr:ferrous iron transport protein A [Bacteroidales bacterium]